MEAGPKKQKPSMAVVNEPEMMFSEEERVQIAKFLDALLEADMTNKCNERRNEQ